MSEIRVVSTFHMLEDADEGDADVVLRFEPTLNAKSARAKSAYLTKTAARALRDVLNKADLGEEI